ncbi:MAG: two-component system response regulator [Frondihabitans sp.]|nr:two-component system response regulator [Frondihabitans sp.]
MNPASDSHESDDPQLIRADGSPVRVLVVDDEESLTDLLSIAFRYQGWMVETAADGRSAFALVRSFHPDVIVLDVLLPDVDGLEVLRGIRASRIDTPVLFLSAKDSLRDLLAGLEKGGDDYVTKPFSLNEVVARLRAILRRTRSVAPGDQRSRIAVGDLVLNEEKCNVSRGGRDIELTATEFELLRFLMRNPRRVLSRAQILQNVWGYDFGAKTSVVEIYISYLRRKIEARDAPMIHTVRSVGYVIKPAD